MKLTGRPDDPPRSDEPMSFNVLFAAIGGQPDRPCAWHPVAVGFGQPAPTTEQLIRIGRLTVEAFSTWLAGQSERTAGGEVKMTGPSFEACLGLPRTPADCRKRMRNALLQEAVMHLDGETLNARVDALHAMVKGNRYRFDIWRKAGVPEYVPKALRLVYAAEQAATIPSSSRQLRRVLGMPPAALDIDRR